MLDVFENKEPREQRDTNSGNSQRSNNLTAIHADISSDGYRFRFDSVEHWPSIGVTGNCIDQAIVSLKLVYGFRYTMLR